MTLHTHTFAKNLMSYINDIILVFCIMTCDEDNVKLNIISKDVCMFEYDIQCEKSYLRSQYTDKNPFFDWTNKIGSSLIKSVTFKFGSDMFSYSSEYLKLWNDLAKFDDIIPEINSYMLKYYGKKEYLDLQDYGMITKIHSNTKKLKNEYIIIKIILNKFLNK